MNESDFDRIIDTATADMIEREPSPALRHKIMARVRESDPPAPRRFVWVTAGLAAAVCLVFALVMVDRTPTPLVESTPPARPTIVERPSATTDQSVPRLEPAPQAVVRVAPRRLPPNDLAIDAITTELLVLPSIDLPPIENEEASVEGLEIEALTIEPLTASND